jgi:hypothetical protein
LVGMAELIRAVVPGSAVRHSPLPKRVSGLGKGDSPL